MNFYVISHRLIQYNIFYIIMMKNQIEKYSPLRRAYKLKSVLRKSALRKMWSCHRTQTNYGQRVKFSLLPVFLSEVLLESSHSHLLSVAGFILQHQN